MCDTSIAPVLNNSNLRLSWCCHFLGVASAQIPPQLSSCLTKDQNLDMYCKFTLDPKIKETCYYMTENKLVGSTNISSSPDSTFKNRANVSIVKNVCTLNLKGFSADQPKTYTCFIKQTATPVSVSAEVDKSKQQNLNIY